MQASNDQNEWINQIEEVISKKHIKYYEYKDFYNVEKIGNDNFGKVYRANWKNSVQYFVLKSVNLNNDTIKEIIYEFELHHKFDFQKYIIQFFGITNKESQNGQLKEYLLVMEYADGGSLQNYLKENFKKLSWKEKYKLAFQLTCAVSYLHDNGIVHHDLHSNNILVHQNIIKLANFGLSNSVKVSKQQLDLLDIDRIIPYIDPIILKNNDNLMQPYLLNEKCNVYSIGVLLWEISNGQQPFKDESCDADLIMRIIQGHRETIVPNTPTDYFNLYTECWNGEPYNRPNMKQVVANLKAIIIKADIIIEDCQTDNKHQVNSVNNSLHEKLSQYDFDKLNIKEMKPTTQNINETIFEEDLSIVIDELVDLRFKEANEGKDEIIRKKHFFDHINNYKIKIQEIFNWLLNNQNNSSNSIYLLGYFNYNGIEIEVNKQNAIKLYQKAIELENNMAQFDLAYIYIIEDNSKENYHEAFELLDKVAVGGYSSGINMLGYCYEHGIGITSDVTKAFELYQNAADLGNSYAMSNLGWCYENLYNDEQKAFELYQKAADLGNSFGMYNLGYCYKDGYGTDLNLQKAFESYQKASNLGVYTAQCELALMYEKGEGIQKDMNQAIYWYKKSAKQGNKCAQNKLKDLSIEY